MRRALNLDQPLATTAEAIRYHGYVQIDPIDVCGKMHDLILRNRVKGYRRDDLLKTLYQAGPRQFFEHYIPGRGILVALPVEDYRFLQSHMKQRRTGSGYGGAMDASQKRMAAKILARIRDEGPLGAAHFTDSGRSTTGWGSGSTLAKTALDKLFFHGKLLISRRDNFRRIYDLPERVLPAEVLEAKPATPREIKRWLVLEKLHQRRLALLSPAQKTLVKDVAAEVNVNGQGGLFCLNEDAERLTAAMDGPEAHSHPRLLGPLDPLIYDRNVTRRIWEFDYTWEVYTPPTKRVRGYYALPVLAGNRIVGHVDPKADRATGTLHVKVAVEKGIDLTRALEEFIAFLSVKSVQLQEAIKRS